MTQPRKWSIMTGAGHHAVSAVPTWAQDEHNALVDLLLAAQRDLAECYRLSGADPDGDEDWRLAELAVMEVRQMREEWDAERAQHERELADLRERCAQAIGRGSTISGWVKDVIKAPAAADAVRAVPLRREP